MSNPTFAVLEQFLLAHGFERRPVAGNYLLFEHPEADAQLLLPPYKAEETVAPRHMVYVRHTLDAWNIMDRDEFDAMMSQRTLAG